MWTPIRLAVLLLGFSLFCFVPNDTSAQQFRLNKANRKYEQFQFRKALDIYHKVLDKYEGNSKATIRIADIHRRLGNYEKQAEWYAKVVELDEAQPIHYYYSAQALRSQEEYSKARKYYQKYAELVPDDSRGIRLADACDDISVFYSDSARYNTHQLSINSPKPDFSPAFYEQNSIVFASGRSNKAIALKDAWSNASFLDLYQSEKQGSFTDPERLKGEVNTRFHEGPLVFTDSFRKMYFTRNAYIDASKKPSDEGIVSLNIFHAQQKNGKWKDVKGVHFNSNQHSVGHPALTPDGDTMYFASDRKGGQGGLDIWRVSKTDSGWGQPVNLGGKINTKGNEHFPFYHPSGKLYYASDALPGLGGLDIYRAEKQKDGFSFPHNMGYPINSTMDDFGLILQDDEKSGYFSSNREGGSGDDDIYSFNVSGVILKGLVYDKDTEEPISLADVELIQDGDTIGGKPTDDEGRFRFQLVRGEEYKVAASKNYYTSNTKTIDTKKPDSNVIQVDIPLQKEGDINLAGKVVDANSGESLENVNVSLQNRTDEDTSTLITAADGKFSFPLDWDKEYNLMGEKPRYFLQEPVNIRTIGLEKPQTIDTIIEMYKLEPETVIELENIYFDLDKWNIRPDARAVLDKLVDLMEKYPAMTIQMRSHTDSRATDTYNKWLSFKRAESSAKYVISQGIDPSRIRAKGFGETQLVNECKDGVKCSEEKHQQNRRTEFKVIEPPKENVKIESRKASDEEDETSQ